MPWKKVPPENAELLARVVPNIPDAELKKMFGCPAYFVNGYMFTGAHQDDFILRLSQEDQDEIFQLPGTRIFDPMEGRPMKDYVLLPPSVYGNKDEFTRWLERSAAYTRSLPPKEKKPKKSK